MRIKRANAEQKAVYRENDWHVYPLYGFVKISGQDCYVEDLRGFSEKEEPKYEIIVPDGYIFVPDCLHTLLCYDLQDVRDRADGGGLEKCEDQRPGVLRRGFSEKRKEQ